MKRTTRKMDAALSTFRLEKFAFERVAIAHAGPRDVAGLVDGSQCLSRRLILTEQPFIEPMQLATV